MREQFYYIATPDEVFEDVKSASIKLWRTYSDEFGYASEKVERIENIKNVRDNTCYMIAMFDSNNQAKLRRYLTLPASIEWYDKLMEIYKKECEEIMKEIV
jgi:hypothetical protein